MFHRAARAGLRTQRVQSAGRTAERPFVRCVTIWRALLTTPWFTPGFSICTCIEQRFLIIPRLPLSADGLQSSAMLKRPTQRRVSSNLGGCDWIFSTLQSAARWI
jgi:hypothetical protein